MWKGKQQTLQRTGRQLLLGEVHTHTAPLRSKWPLCRHGQPTDRGRGGKAQACEQGDQLKPGSCSAHLRCRQIGMQGMQWACQQGSHIMHCTSAHQIAAPHRSHIWSAGMPHALTCPGSTFVSGQNCSGQCVDSLAPCQAAAFPASWRLQGSRPTCGSPHAGQSASPSELCAGVASHDPPRPAQVRTESGTCNRVGFKLARLPSAKYSSPRPGWHCQRRQ